MHNIEHVSCSNVNDRFFLNPNDSLKISTKPTMNGTKYPKNEQPSSNYSGKSKASKRTFRIISSRSNGIQPTITKATIPLRGRRSDNAMYTSFLVDKSTVVGF